MTEAEEQILLRMTKEIYHHLGLDGQGPVLFSSVKNEVNRNILKWKDRRSKKNHVR